MIPDTHCDSRWRRRYFQATSEQRLVTFMLHWMSVAAALLLLGTHGVSLRIAGDGWEASLQIGSPPALKAEEQADGL